jgi:pimeloyl-ACP methyl ester carboxylesterase
MKRTLATALTLAALMIPVDSLKAEQPTKTTAKAATTRVRYQTIKAGGQDVFYREAGPKNGPVVLLLHGFPTSSRMFRNLIPQLADRYRVIAPDYPGYGESSMPQHDQFAYTFDNLANVIDDLITKLGVTRYTMYVMDYGAPVGWRLALKHPERVQALIVQNGNAYEEGLPDSFWGPIKKYWKEKTPSNRDALRGLLKLEATKWQYTTGVTDTSLLDPDTWTADQYGLDRKGNDEIQLDLFYDYGSNLALYPTIQKFFRDSQVPTLIVWGKGDPIFPPVGAHPYKRDLPKAELHLLDTGHFALETHGEEMASLIRAFLAKNLTK